MHLVLELPVIGELCNWTALISACICIALYAVVWSGNERGRILARIAFGITVVMVTAGSTALMALILLQRYDIEYVVSYTSRELPLFYRITAFWAGQEGSLLLWALCSFIVGAILLWRLSKRDERQWEAPTMLFFVCAQLFMLALLVAKSPFEQLPHALPDGRGLNPLLQDPWMGIHPPLVLAGYALLSIPFACALSMMALREYEGELQEMRRWLLLGWCVLGAGIIVGGYWAYRVLGWGGYWGWDPVENASLVPWLTATALLHGLLLQRRAGALIRMNSILSIITYVLVIYATFLTRNSALEGASVHSFAQTKPLVYQLLLAFMVAYFIGGVGMVIWRWRDMPAKPAYSSPRSLNFAVWCGMLTLLTMAVWIEFGTSLPLLNPLLREPVRVAPSFFNRTTAPLALLLALLLSGGLWLGLKNWRIPTVVIPLSLTGLLTILSFIFGIRNPYYLMLFCIAFLII
ncbi:MAG TPA: cytochrome C biogenesis protein, partial [Armatimonadetes bacterium]|nr:cytochrome C biogenesis protein [Armatimonadota bacterium]